MQIRRVGCKHSYMGINLAPYHRFDASGCSQRKYVLPCFPDGSAEEHELFGTTQATTDILPDLLPDDDNDNNKEAANDVCSIELANENNEEMNANVDETVVEKAACPVQDVSRVCCALGMVHTCPCLLSMPPARSFVSQCSLVSPIWPCAIMMVCMQP